MPKQHVSAESVWSSFDTALRRNDKGTHRIGLSYACGSRQAAVMTPAQSRMARAALEWTIDLACKKAGVPRMVIIRFESGQPIAADARDDLRRAYEDAGAEVVTDGAGAHSVRFIGGSVCDTAPGTLRVV